MSGRRARMRRRDRINPAASAHMTSTEYETMQGAINRHPDGGLYLQATWEHVEAVNDFLEGLDENGLLAVVDELTDGRVPLELTPPAELRRLTKVVYNEDWNDLNCARDAVREEVHARGWL